MPRSIVEFTADKRFARRGREVNTLSAMVRIYCEGHRHSNEAGQKLCTECGALLDYAVRRTERCVFGDAKPTCANCLVHCYTAEMREKVRVVMRWAGPRMMFRHPILAVAHKLDGLRPSPRLPAKPTRQQNS